jgi:hypothetical protein
MYLIHHNLKFHFSIYTKFISRANILKHCLATFNFKVFFLFIVHVLIVSSIMKCYSIHRLINEFDLWITMDNDGFSNPSFEN